MKNNGKNAAKNIFALSSASVLTLVLLAWGCSTKVERSDEIIKSTQFSRDGRPKPGEPPKGGVVAFADNEIFDYLTRACGGCHGPEGAYRSNWDLPARDKLSASTLEGVAGITRAFQAIANKYDGNEGASPSAMPLNVDFAANPTAKQDAARALKWFADKLPSVVQDAASLYPRDSSGASLVTTSDVRISFNYKCKQVRTGRSYLTKLTSSLFNRNPTDAEFALLGDEADKPVSREKRQQLARKILPKVPPSTDPVDPWIEEFERQGLKKFALKIADSTHINDADIDPAATRSQIKGDLKNEFYELLKKYYKAKSYREILLLDKVMVTARTAPLYQGCTHSGATPDTFSECTLPADRANYFGTVSYMRAKPQSFLENSNNYGRAGAMFVVSSGEALLPQTNGPVGVEVAGLPECLTNSTKDARGRVNTTAQAGDEPLTGPYGSLTIPGFGNVCQGCHVRRGLAAGSKVYRSFGKFGEKITAATLDAACGTITNGVCQFPAANPYSGDLRMAIAEDKRSYEAAQKRFNAPAPAQKSRGAELDRTIPVTVDFLKQLLAETTDGKGSCIPVDAKTVKNVASIKEMAEFVVGTEGNVARGLARLIPKAIAGTQLTNQEVVMEVNKASSEGMPSKGMLGDMIAAYLSTETFACQEE